MKNYKTQKIKNYKIQKIKILYNKYNTKTIKHKKYTIIIIKKL